MASKSLTYPIWALIASLAGFCGLQVLAYLHAGTFEYPLDDVYIHLSMASHIAQGTYGVNAGEPASAASSILYPLLLLPFPNTTFQWLLPVFWNVLAVAGCGWVWGRIVAAGEITGPLGWVLVLAGPVFLNMSGVGFTGMEAAPHMLASLLIVYGLWRALQGEGVAVWFILAAIAAPLLRYEGLALALAAAGVLALHGSVRAGLVIAAGALGGVIAQGFFLISLGLDPLPSSVLTKMLSVDPGDGALARALVGFVHNLNQPAGALIGALLLAVLLLVAAFPALRRGRVFWFLAAVWLSGLGHMIAGQIGWLHRYEPYILVSLLGALLLAGASVAPGPGGALRALVVMAVPLAGVIYLPSLLLSYTWNPRAVHLQQAQMARFVRDYLKAPVAVNDLGWVTWGNPDYVLDLWGLGSAEARKIRLAAIPPAPGWAGPLAARHGVKAAMIYDPWIGSGIPADWVRLGALNMTDPRGAIGGFSVGIYATDPADAPEIRAKLAEFGPTLPVGAFLTLEAKP